MTTTDPACDPVPAEYVSSFFGVCNGDTEYMDHYRDVGASWVRQDSRWEQTELSEGEFDWSMWDALYDGFTDRGIDVMPILDYTAPWASTADEDAPKRERDHSPAADVDNWRRYVRKFVERYPDIDYFEVWNEPNLDHFLYTDRPNYEVYVERILEPAAAVVHDHGKYVVAPTFTVEHPDIVPSEAKHAPGGASWNVGTTARCIDRWLTYREAWKHIDYLSVHYTKGDTPKREFPYAENMMPFYDYVYENWIEPGKIRGIWNTEEGHTAVEPGDSGFAAMEPWERNPPEQWVPRYTVPVLHWGLRRGFDHPDQYKVFWFSMGGGRGALEAHNLLVETESGFKLTDTARALRTTSDVLTDADAVGAYAGNVDVGLGLFSIEEGGKDFDDSAWEFTSYAFALDDDVFVAAWLDLPGIEPAKYQPEGSKIQARIGGLDPDGDVDVRTTHYVSGEEGTADSIEWHDGDLRLRLPRNSDPVLYFRVQT